MTKITDLPESRPRARPEIMAVHHINGDRLDNSPGNLALVGPEALPIRVEWPWPPGRRCWQCGGPYQGHSRRPFARCVECLTAEKAAACVKLQEMAHSLADGEDGASR